ncbi:NADPH-dependent FMN reductase [Streptomyces sp. P38-E01]|uniref:NADPH-dependent FMN reductase n=1 Tax=Streptomyces tardus TaxID=2780544 RepID=A0A949JKK1_9ACTN|nr:NADPH-dependent FMN reductase [Streptomyces tardus]MBU7600478.1 NADPH-dependent FMN reductase [Streptomyces tardus]
MAHVLALTGSPSPTSRTNALVRHVGSRLSATGHTVDHLDVRDLPPVALLAADASHPAIAAALAAVAEADAVVIGTPVYKAAYSGLLKTLLDLLPQSALAGKTVLPLATGGTPAHVLAIDYGLRPVLTSLGTDSVLRGWFVTDRELSLDADGGLTLGREAAEGVEAAVERLTTALAARDALAPRDAPTAHAARGRHDARGPGDARVSVAA